ncbi:hypothetical protein [uncultured Microbacterium sp.]|uniref:hypothetical protein n=1 Tax=uncultured Microbacterium sp. TaxID=191216 RepID=UPI002601DD5F|nr:hypothetical protein [uncultured Microbacterium sp.]
MSRATAAAALPVPSKPAARPARRLTTVTAPARKRRPKLIYALIALGGAAAIGAAQVGLSLAITRDSFVLADLTSQQRELDLRSSALSDDLAGLASPQRLATKADELGMIVAGSASYLRLSDSAVLGADAGAGWYSSVDPTGTGAVQNALLEAKAAAAAESSEAAEEETPAPVESNLPPTLDDGLPSPTTR